MTRQDVLDALETVIFALKTYDITTIRTSIGMLPVAKYVHENGYQSIAQVKSLMNYSGISMLTLHRMQNHFKMSQ